MTDGLTERDREGIRTALRESPKVRRAVLFGSRALGTFRGASDVDLALEGDDINLADLISLQAKIAKLDLPIEVDAIIRDKTNNPALEEHIKKFGQEWYRRGGGAAEGWTPCRLGDVVAIKHGFAFKGKHFTEDETSDVVVTPGNFAIGGGFQEGKPKYYTGPVPDEYVLHEGDLIVTMTDLSKAGDTLGYPALVPRSPSKRYLHNQRIGLVAIIDNAEVDKLFLFYRLRASDYRHHVLATASGSTVRHTSPGRIYEFETTLPGIGEQRAIAGVLGALDDKIELNRRTSRTLEKLARAIFRAWFVDFEPVKAKAAGARSFPSMPQQAFDALPTRLVPSELGPIPEGWEVKKVGDCITRHRVGKKYNQKTVLPTGNVPVLDQGKSGIIGYHNDEPGVAASLKEPKIVFANHTCYMRLITFPFSTIQNVLPFTGKGVDTIWIYYATLDIQPFIEYKGHWPDFVINEIVVPPREFQTTFRTCIHPMIAKSEQVDRESRKLAALRDYLLPKLLSGEVRVGDADGFMGGRGL